METYLLTGSNMGDRAAFLAAASNGVSKLGTIVATSSIFESGSWGKEDRPDYLNQVIHLETALEAEVLLAKLLAIEEAMGRERGQKWESRIIDIDILFFGGLVLDTPSLKVPHPHLEERAFTLEPLAEIAPELKHPVHGATATQMLEDCTDPVWVRKWDAHVT